MLVIFGCRLVFSIVLLLLTSACSYHEMINQTVTGNTDQKNKAILKLDTYGHEALIRDLLISTNTDLISASDDKTIRVWDSQTGKEKRKILGQIGQGDVGKIYAIALSADNQYLAVGGYMGGAPGEMTLKKGIIKIYHYPSGKLIQVLKSHMNVVLDLNFSADNHYLVSSSADHSVKLWKVDDWTLQETMTNHDEFVYAVLMLTHPQGGYDIYSVGFDKKVSLHHFKNNKLMLVNEFSGDYKFQYLASNNKHIAVSGGSHKIFILNRDLTLAQTITSNTIPEGLAYSPDGKTLATGTASHPLEVHVYQLPDYVKSASFKNHTNLTKSLAFLDNQTIVSAGGDNNEIFIWDKVTAKITTKIIGVGQTIWSVGIKEGAIAWGNQAKNVHNNRAWRLQTWLNLHEFDRHSNPQNFRRIYAQQGTYRLSHSKGGDYDYTDGVLTINHKGKKIARIIRDSSTGHQHRIYGWYGDLIISGGNSGHLKIYNLDGKEIASLIGHTGEIWSMAVDEQRLVTGGNDQVLRLWDLSVLNQEDPPSKIYPLLNVFISRDDEYVAWTKEGFFDASKEGAKYIGYHINKGEEAAAEFVSVDKFYNSFYRPDLIAKTLKGEDISGYFKELSIEKTLKTGLAPTVKFNTKSHFSENRDVTLSLKLCEKDGGYDNVTLYLNGVAVNVLSSDDASSASKKTSCFNVDHPISLVDGENILSFRATNKTGNIDSNTAKITLKYQGHSRKKPTLHILALGVDKYRDGDLQLNYSVADATGFLKAMTTAAESLFTEIKTYQLTDSQVTKKNIFLKFNEIAKKTTNDDVFMLYMAGHGITDPKTGSYFYIPYDFRYTNDDSVRERGMSQKDFKLALSKIQALKSLTIIDTCNSGSFAEAQASRGMSEKTAINKLTRATGRSTIVASSKDQVALEGYKGHGVFTYTLIEALKGKGYGRNNTITIKGLAAYIEDVLPDRTYKKWGYEQVPQSHITGNDFPIGIRLNP